MYFKTVIITQASKNYKAKKRGKMLKNVCCGISTWWLFNIPLKTFMLN